MTMIAHPAIELIVECTGNPLLLSTNALVAFAAGKHVISGTVEDAICGAALVAREEASVIYSQAYGDQPAMTCDLVDWREPPVFTLYPQAAVTSGSPIFDSPHRRPSGRIGAYTRAGRALALEPEDVQQLSRWTTAIECAAICNATGLDAPSEGLSYPSGSVDDIANLMRSREVGGVLEAEGQVEVINSLTPDGVEIPRNIRTGVWVAVKALTDYQKHCFEEYFVHTDDSGLYFCKFNMYHLIGLELGMSIANVGIRGESTGTSREFRADVVAVAKRDLRWEVLDGEGGYCVAGQLRPSMLSVPMRALPLVGPVMPA